MSAFLSIARWQVRTSLRRVSTWVYFTIFFAMAFLWMLAAAGTWEQIALALGTGGKVYANAPIALLTYFSIVSLFGVPITAAIVGNAICRDFQVGIDPLFFTTPVSKLAFLGGRFAGAMFVNLLLVLGIGLGTLLATVMPWVNADKVGAFHLAHYLIPYATHLVPNLLLTGAIFFALAALTRQMLPNYVGGAILLVGYLLSRQAFNDIGDKATSALIDPFGMRAAQLTTEYWSIAEQNARVLPLSSFVVQNRLLWLGVAFAILAFAYHRFSFSHGVTDRKKKRTLADPALARATSSAGPLRVLDLPAVTQRFGAGAFVAQYLSVLRRSFWSVVSNVYFVAILIGGLLYLIPVSLVSGRLFGTNTWPVTHQMVETVGGSFNLFVFVIIAFYSGELVWAERDAHIEQIYDATPVANAATLLAKLTAMIGIILSLLVVSLLASIMVQAVKGYFHFELGVYAKALFGVTLIDMVLVAVLAFAIHVLVNQKYVGHLAVILFFIGNGLLSQIGLEHNLYSYTSDGGSVYSDLNGYGPFMKSFVIWKLYWSAFAGLVLVATALGWVRGLETHSRWRMRLAKDRFRGPLRVATAVSALAFIGLGGFIFYNTNVRNDYTTSRERRRIRVERERLYKKYEAMPQPRIAATTVRVDLDPEQQNIFVKGQYVLKNASATPVDTIQLVIEPDFEIRSLRFGRPATRVLADSVHAFSMYRLASPLAPGDSLTFDFDYAGITHGFTNDIDNTQIVSNGSFVSNSLFMPSIGYDDRRELTDDDTRKREHLPERPRMRPPTAAGVRDRNYVSHDADWMRFAATVCTAPDQIGLTSGYLQREWTENGRRCFAYTMDAPILDLWAVQSARYAVAKDRWRDVDIQVLYHPAHAFNVKRMIDATKKSLDYYTEHFGPYQHKQLRIVEFPRYALFAQSLPNTIPYSEDIGFIARLEDPNDIDYPFYVTAHEVAHQWWAHQVIGANAQGSMLLSETLAQYSALMVMEKEYGGASMRRFLEYELDRYLAGRATERKREMPLDLGENQPYIHYNKGSLVMYALRDYIGEERMNTIIRGFLDQWKFKGPPYPTSLDFVSALRAGVPDSLRYVVDDLVDRITLYELKADSSKATQLPDDKWRVDLWITTKKLRADSVGKETEVPMSDWIDVGVFAVAPKGTKAPDVNGIPIYLKKHRISSGASHLELVVDQRPSSAGIDPMHKLIDRYTKDNTVFARQPLTPRKAPAAGATSKPAPTGRESLPTPARPAGAR